MTGEITFEVYSDDRLAVRGDRGRYQKLVRGVGGRWNPRMRGGQGWLVPVDRRQDLENLIAGLGDEGAQGQGGLQSEGESSCTGRTGSPAHTEKGARAAPGSAEAAPGVSEGAPPRVRSRKGQNKYHREKSQDGGSDAVGGTLDVHGTDVAENTVGDNGTRAPDSGKTNCSPNGETGGRNGGKTHAPDSGRAECSPNGETGSRSDDETRAPVPGKADCNPNDEIGSRSGGEAHTPDSGRAECGPNDEIGSHSGAGPPRSPAGCRVGSLEYYLSFSKRPSDFGGLLHERDPDRYSSSTESDSSPDGFPSPTTPRERAGRGGGGGSAPTGRLPGAARAVGTVAGGPGRHR